MKPDKTYLSDTHLAGRLYHRADDAWDRLRVGTKVALLRDPENRHDPSAVEVHFIDGETDYMLGYLPREANELPAAMIDMGWGEAIECVISRIDPSAPYDEQISLILSIVRNRKADDDRQTAQPSNQRNEE